MILLPGRQHDDAHASKADKIRAHCDGSITSVDKRPFSSAKCCSAKRLGILTRKAKKRKSFFHFPNPQKSVEDYKTCKAWLENLKNARLPRKVEDYKWKISHHLCEDHFMSGCFKDAFGRSVTSSLNFAG